MVFEVVRSAERVQESFQSSLDVGQKNNKHIVRTIVSTAGAQQIIAYIYKAADHGRGYAVVFYNTALAMHFAVVVAVFGRFGFCFSNEISNLNFFLVN